MENGKARLDISTFSGSSHLFLYFNYAQEEAENLGDAYELLKLVLYRYLILRFREEGVKRFDDKNFYKVECTDGTGGFCLSVELAEPDEKGSLELVADALGFADSFKPEDFPRYPDEECRKLVVENVEGMKNLASELRKQIFEEQSYTFKTEYVSFFD